MDRKPSVKRPTRAVHGVLVLDKPAGLSSARAVDLVKRALNADRAGHGGTLDPLATGVLPVCLGAATKLAQYLLAEDKAYEAEGVLGVETDTLDRTGRVVAERPIDPARATEQGLRAALAARLGEQTQVPPLYSAIKQGGVELYKRARRGEEVERAPRQIRIDRLELLAFEPPHFRVAIACSKGTYVRSLLADLGNDLGCGAHLGELRRTRSGRFDLAQAVSLDHIEDLATLDRLVPLLAATELPTFAVPEALMVKVRHAVQVPAAELGAALPADPEARFLLVDEAGRLVAIAHGAPDGRLIYDRVFPELVDLGPAPA